MTGPCQQHDVNEKSVILCVPTTSIAEEIILTMQKLSSGSLQLNKLENLLLLDKESEVHSDVRQFSLEKILNLYCNALLFWKQHVHQTIDALRKYNHQYEYHVNINPDLQFLDYFKRKFSAAYKDVSGCLRFLLRLPEDSFIYVDFKAISALIIQLKDFHTSLMSEELEEGVLKSVLNVRGASKRFILHNHGFQLAQKLNKRRVGCIVSLELLNSSLELKYKKNSETSKPFETRADVAKYLMMKSKLMIHIPSSSSFFNNILSASQKLYDLLVVCDAKCKEATDLSNIQALLKAKNMGFIGDGLQLHKYEIDMNKHGHVLFEALLSMGLKTHKPTSSEIFWIGIPKDLLAPVRNQGNTETCAFHSSLATTETHYKHEAYSDTPRRTFSITFCEDDMDKQYEKLTGTILGHEKKKTECKDWKTRLEYSFMVLEKLGVLGYSPTRKSEDEKVPIAFRISSFRKYSIIDLTNVCELLKDNKVMSGYFRLSRNYFTLSPGQTYKYDPQQPLLNQNAKVCSHAVMLVGVLPTKVANVRESEHKVEKKKIISLAYQNSYGKLFGEHNGFSRIEASSVIRFFLPIL